MGSALGRVRRLAYRVLWHGLMWAQPRDADFMSGRLERGDIVWRAFKEAGTALTRCGRLDEAEAMLARGLAAFPGDADLLAAFAMAAHNTGRYALAAERWRAALAAGSDDWMCRPGLAANLRMLGDLEGAQAAINEALRRTPTNLTVITEAARLAVARGRFRDALPLWERAVSTPKPHPDWLQGHAQTLVRLGDYAEAQAALHAARGAFPDHAGLDGVEGALAAAREDWPTAIAHWTAFRRRHPDDATGWQQLGIAVAQQLADTGVPVGPDEFRAVLPAKIDVVDDEALRQLMLRFESIGDNCELGLVQRRYAAEPLGLLRWNTVAYDRLLQALAERFAGMGEEANTSIVVAPNGEYYMQDRRWSLGMHTFLYEGQADQAALYAKMCRRIAFLRDKLLADLAAAEKIFVYRSPGIDGDRLETLHRALGPVRLMAVQPARGGHGFEGTAGDVLKVGEERFVGFVDRPGSDPSGTWNIPFDDWAAICRKVVEAA